MTTDAEALAALRKRVKAVLDWNWDGMLDQCGEDADAALDDTRALQEEFDGGAK